MLPACQPAKRAEGHSSRRKAWESLRLPHRGGDIKSPQRLVLSPLRGSFLVLFLPPMATRWGETQENVAQGSLSSLADFPPRRGLGGAAMGNPDYLVCGAARARPAGRAAGPERGPCATRFPWLSPWATFCRRYAACLRSLLFPMACVAQPMRTRGFETESRGPTGRVRATAAQM